MTSLGDFPRASRGRAAPTRSDTDATSDRSNRRASSSSNRDPRPTSATQIVRATKVN